MELKISWLSDLDNQVFLEVFRTHGDCPQEDFSPYEDTERELLIQAPFARDIYCFYLQSCMDRENGETGRYNQSAALFNAAMEAFKNQYNRSHEPKSPGPFLLKGEIKCPISPF